MSTALVKADNYQSPISWICRQHASRCAVLAIWSLAQGLKHLSKSQMSLAKMMFIEAAKSGALTVTFRLVERQIRINNWKDFCGAKA